MHARKIIFAVILAAAFVFVIQTVSVRALPSPVSGTEAVLTAKEVGVKLFPEKVFFRGQLAPTQARNTAGVHFADDFYAVAGLCDSSGYSTDVRQKFQGYLLTEVPLEIGGQSLKAGAYGFGFAGGQFVVMDIAANDLFHVAAAKDDDLKRPTPLQIAASPAKGTYRLYAGREYVELHRAQ